MSTIMAPLTALQKSAVIVLRVSGKGAYNVLSFFELPEGYEQRKVVKGKYFSRSTEGVVDEVLITFFKAPFSYTGEDILEISFHGNPIIVRAAMSDFMSIGIRVAEGGEFTRRAILNEKITTLQAEGINALISSNTAEGIRQSYLSLNGALNRQFDEIKGYLKKLLANIEASIDFDDGDDLLSFSTNAAFTSTLDRIEKLISSYERNMKAVNGVRVCIAGEPNSGKSTLFNMLIGKDRAIVTDEPGTTRDLLTESISSGGINIILTDTAGIRQSESQAEKIGIKKSLNTVEDSDLILITIDMSCPLGCASKDILEKTKDKNRIIIGTKGDLDISNEIEPDIIVSVTQGLNIDLLKGLIEEKCTIEGDTEEAGLLAERQYLSCNKALTSLNVLKDKSLSIDQAAYHCRRGLEELCFADGEDVVESVLDVLFKDFCIGK